MNYTSTFFGYLMDVKKTSLSNFCRDKHRHFCGDNTVYLKSQYFLEWHKKHLK